MMTTQGKGSMKKSKPSYFMAILGVALVLFILGILGWLVINTSKLETYFKGSVQVHAFVREGSPQKDIDVVKNIIKSKTYARNVEYITKEKARETFIGDGNQDWNKVLDYNPLPASIDFYLEPDYVNKDSLKVITAEIMKNFIISEVKYPDAVVTNLNNVVKKAGYFLLGLAGILALIVIILIDNTIKLAMFSNRFLIKTMQMVGATRWFISKPFDSKAIINGLISALLAITAILVLIYAVESWWLPEIKALKDNTSLFLLFLALILIGISITFISTHRSVTKYLKMKLDDLY
ncbi:MAG: cell division protein FtsX [Bacteroidota bacterium]|jgi:cell division transport system permease protein|nr:permease-like cell division protein FtsX [Chitinophagaceae bacterium]MCE2758206.1 permease-like cell division protein FtsX [Chitinophagaceae bacterium]GDX43269.1 cell division protein FtsX [Bacteroidota bacterium]